MATQGERLAKAEAFIEFHKDACEKKYRDLDARMARFEQKMDVLIEKLTPGSVNWKKWLAYNWWKLIVGMGVLSAIMSGHADMLAGILKVSL